jgi:hypothetical protein
LLPIKYKQSSWGEGQPLEKKGESEASS